MNLLDDVYFFHREEQKWKPSFLISIIKDSHYDDVIFKRYIVAGYGPHLPIQKVLTLRQYEHLVRHKKLEEYTNKVKEVK